LPVTCDTSSKFARNERQLDAVLVRGFTLVRGSSSSQRMSNPAVRRFRTEYRHETRPDTRGPLRPFTTHAAGCPRPMGSSHERTARFSDVDAGYRLRLQVQNLPDGGKCCIMSGRVSQGLSFATKDPKWSRSLKSSFGVCVRPEPRRLMSANESKFPITPFLTL
jgi:hypothetical protein